MTGPWRVVDSPVGPLRLGADRSGRLTEVRIGVAPPQSEPGSHHGGAWYRERRRGLDDAAAQLDEYFTGGRRSFDLRLSFEGSAFQLRVWDALQKIPFGTTVSYRQLAAQLGRPGAARAVGHANARNPIAVVIPCHRVIGSSGQLTGYGGGLGAKRQLLELEAGVLLRGRDEGHDVGDDTASDGGS